jgi:hypothetical protein
MQTERPLRRLIKHSKASILDRRRQICTASKDGAGKRHAADNQTDEHRRTEVKVKYTVFALNVVLRSEVLLLFSYSRFQGHERRNFVRVWIL